MDLRRSSLETIGIRVQPPLPVKLPKLAVNEVWRCSVVEACGQLIHLAGTGVAPPSRIQTAHHDLNGRELLPGRERAVATPINRHRSVERHLAILLDL